MKTIGLLTIIALTAVSLPVGGGMRVIQPGSVEDLQHRIITAARLKGLSPALALAVAQVESTFKPGTHCTAERKSQSCGLFQVWVPTARYLKYTGPVADLVKPDISIELGTLHLQKCQARYGHNVAKVACCHNAGLQRPATRCTVDPGVAEYVSKVSTAYTAWNAKISN